LEVSLRTIGYGFPTDYFIKTGDGRFYRENRQFGWQFFPHDGAIIPNPVRFAAVKPPGTLRVFILGESAAAGSPNPAFGFGRILEVMLAQQYPEKRFEFVNAAMRGVDSKVVLQIARECARHEPDLFIIYTGNNEFVSFHTTGQESVISSWRHPFAQWLRSTKLAQLTQNARAKLERLDTNEVVWDMPFFHTRRLAAEDPRRLAVYRGFGAAFSKICDVTLNSGAPVIVSSVGVNFRDCPPFGSLHRAGLTDTQEQTWSSDFSAGIESEKDGDFNRAIQHYEAAAALDDQYAELPYRMARCFFAQDRIALAVENFRAARDRDALQFRADSRINAILRSEATARERRGITWIDVERALAESASKDQGLPGDRLFYDHVHFRFEGDYEVAKTLWPTVVNALGLTRRSDPALSRQQCSDLLAYTRWDESNLEWLMLDLTRRPPFLDQVDHALRQSRDEALWRQREQGLNAAALADDAVRYRESVARRPNDWQLHYNFGFLLEHMGDLSGAVEQFNRTLELFPRLLNVKVELGAACLQAGQVELAIQHLTDAVRIDPHYRRAWQILSQAVRQRHAQVGAPGGALPTTP
jgi:tetratricopeptide (TPR) repeat protein